MISTEQGVYLQFFDEGEPADRELPPLGPFELLIIRHNRIIGDREQVEHDMLSVGSVERWLEAELELRRALGDEPGGVRRSHMRIRAPRGDIIVRFYDYAGDEPPKVPELGPFYALTVGKREVRADDKLIAIRSTDMSAWTLTDAIRPGIAGINKADFSVFSLSVREPHGVTQQPPPQAPPVAVYTPPPVVSAPPPAAPLAPAPMPAQPVAPETAALPGEFVERRKIQREVYVARPLPAQSDEQLTPADVNLILRVDKLKQQELAQQLMVERLRKSQHIDPEASLRSEAIESVPMRFRPPVKEREPAVAEAAEEEYEDLSFATRLLGLLWSARLVLVTLLLIAVGVSAYGYIQPKVKATGAPQLTYASVGDKINTPDWTFTIIAVERPTAVTGATQSSSGGFLAVHITAVRRNQDAPPLDPSAFTLIDLGGNRAAALPSTSDVYAPGTGLLWPSRYPMATIVHDHIVFDANPSAKGLLVLINAANIAVRIPDR